jgi:hypothetical protein
MIPTFGNIGRRDDATHRNIPRFRERSVGANSSDCSNSSDLRLGAVTQEQKLLTTTIEAGTGSG